jgi:hypothetical protein
MSPRLGRQANLDPDVTFGNDCGTVRRNGDLEGRIISLLAENKINKEEQAIECLHILYSAPAVISTGGIHATARRIGNLLVRDAAILGKRSDITVELTRRRESKHPPPDHAS